MSAAGWQVLYVEDDPVNALLMQGILELRAGVTLRVARSGAEALRLVGQGRVDLLLCDLHLPEDGLVGEVYLPFTNKDGTLRAGHEAFNEF